MLLLAVVAGMGWLWVSHRRPSGAQDLRGYVSSSELLAQEFGHYTGKKLKNPALAEAFNYATAMMRSGDYPGAVAQLDGLAKEAPIPIVFNNLGVLYARLGDRGRAVNAFREALSRDGSYRPVRENMERLKGFTANEADPVTREIEPNGTLRSANLIAVGRPVEADIAPNVDDVDWYRFAAPPAPRDIVAIEIANESQTLAPGLNIYDSAGALIQAGRTDVSPGQSITVRLSPAPNSTLNLEIWGERHTIGRYLLTVRALHAFDAYEPNDDIFSATRINIGQAIEANIMDGDDTDYYSFIGPRTGEVLIDVQNRGTTLVPGVATYSTDMRNTGFGPDVDGPGQSLHHTLKVEKNGTYFVQVWSKVGTAGGYTLTIR